MQRILQILFMALLVALAPMTISAERSDDIWLKKGQTENIAIDGGVSITYTGSETTEKPSVLCPMDVKLCTDAITYVSRDPEHGCAFKSCEPMACTDELKLCPDGKTFVSRNSYFNCAFDPCPDATTVCENFLLKYSTSNSAIVDSPLLRSTGSILDKNTKTFSLCVPVGEKSYPLEVLKKDSDGSVLVAYDNKITTRGSVVSDYRKDMKANAKLDADVTIDAIVRPAVVRDKSAYCTIKNEQLPVGTRLRVDNKPMYC